MRLSSDVMILAFCAGLAGCVEAPPPLPQAAAQPAGPGQMNGSYNGWMQLSSGPALSCGTQNTFTIEVRNNAFRYVLDQPQVPWKRQRIYDVVIKADGTFHAASGAAYVSGRVNQGRMQGEIVGDACGYTFQADRLGTW